MPFSLKLGIGTPVQPNWWVMRRNGCHFWNMHLTSYPRTPTYSFACNMILEKVVEPVLVINSGVLFGDILNVLWPCVAKRDKVESVLQDIVSHVCSFPLFVTMLFLFGLHGRSVNLPVLKTFTGEYVYFYFY